MEDNATSESAFDESDLISLGQKLAALDLTAGERTALGALLSDDDVGGFGRIGRFNIAAGIRVGFRTFGRAGRAGLQKSGPGVQFPPGPPNRL